MTANLGEIFQLTLGAIIGFGVNLSMEKHGISLFSSETRPKAISILIVFCTAWIVGMTVITAFFNK